MARHADFDAVLRALLDASAQHREVPLDAVGEAIGTRAFGTDDIEALLDALAQAGRRVTGPRGGGAVGDLQRVIAAAREIAREQGRRATVGELAVRTGLTEDAVRTALALARVMGR